MKTILVALNAKYVHANLAIYDLEAYARTFGGEIFQDGQLKLAVKELTINHNLDFILQELYKEKADVYAFSTYIWNVKEILSIAGELKKVLPNAKIWLGGPEATYHAKHLLETHPFLEGVMLGEGEVTFLELLRSWTAAESYKCNIYENILGITYRDVNAHIYENPARPLMDLDDVPFVYDDLSRFEHKIIYYETSRGCPYSCSYCLSSIDKKVRFRSFSIVKKELDIFLKQRVPQVKFVDRTFNCGAQHSRQIWKYVCEHDNGVTNFHFEVAADLIGEEELEIFKQMRPGLIQLEIGLQTTNPKTLEEIRRHMDIPRLRTVMHQIRKLGNIHQHLDLIAGLPYEDYPSFQNSFNDAFAMQPDQLQLGFLKVLKGSYMEEQTAAYGLQYRDEQPYEVLCTRWIGYDEILTLKKVEEMVELYYNSDQFEHVLLYVLHFYPNPFSFFEALGNYYESQGLFGIGLKREARYTALREFCIQFHTGNNADEREPFSGELFDSLLTFDYYLRENAKNRPSFASHSCIDKTAYQEFFKQGGNKEISLKKEGYDSKAAARMMHIEKLHPSAIFWINQKRESIGECTLKGTARYCLYDYEHRNPLTHDATVCFFNNI